MTFPFFRLLPPDELAKLNYFQLRVYTALVIARAQETVLKAADLVTEARELRALSRLEASGPRNVR